MLSSLITEVGPATHFAIMPATIARRSEESADDAGVEKMRESQFYS
jgi:hypothetical protein